MNHEELAGDIARMHERADHLREDAMRGDESPPIVHRALTELFTSVEELRVVEEELREQNAELVRANAMLEGERRRYADLFENAPVPYAVTDMRGVLCEVNRAAGTLLRTPVTGLLGKPLALLIASGDRHRFRELVARVVGGRIDAETVRIVADDHSIRVLIEGTPQLDPNGATTACRWILEDVEARERAAQAEHLAAEARRKDEFLAMLGHELRNPLAPIRAAVELWRHNGGQLSEQQRQWTVDVVSRQADHLVHLVDDLLDVSRVTHGKIRLHRSEVDLRDVVEQAREVMRSQIQLHRLQLFLPPVPIRVDGDVVRLRQVAVNLLDNAIKFTPRGGAITIRVCSEGGQGRIIVRDEGVGIAPETIATVFGLFAQSEHSLTRAAGGLGLGLALVRRLVELHGGTATIRSEGLGHGTEVEVALPLVVGSSPTRGSVVAPAPTVATLELLVVDDNVDGAQMVGKLLEAIGHRVELAFDGVSAMEAFEQRRPDAVLLDLGLPDIDGVEVGRHMKKSSPSAWLIALTGHGDDRVRAQVREAGFADHLLKPVELESLRRALAKVPDRAG
jgi:PAS domain S-box-containing protein